MTWVALLFALWLYQSWSSRKPHGTNLRIRYQLGRQQSRDLIRRDVPAHWTAITYPASEPSMQISF